MFTRTKVAAAGVVAALAGALVVGGLTGPLAPAFAAPADGATIASSFRQSTPNPSPKPSPKPGQGVGPGARLTPEQRDILDRLGIGPPPSLTSLTPAA